MYIYLAALTGYEVSNKIVREATWVSQILLSQFTSWQTRKTVFNWERYSKSKLDYVMTIVISAFIWWYKCWIHNGHNTRIIVAMDDLLIS